MNSLLSFITIQQKYYHLIDGILRYMRIGNGYIIFGWFIFWLTNPFEYTDFAVFGFLLTEVIYFGIFVLLKHAQKSILDLTSIYESQETLRNNIESITDISELQEKINEIENSRAYFSSLNKMYGLRLLRGIFFWYPSIEDFVMEQYTGIKDLLISCLLTLRSQLDIEKSVLESAKTEVEKNITGTPELLAVSEAQQVRLDRQIEQFEELQRVLVKV